MPKNKVTCFIFASLIICSVSATVSVSTDTSRRALRDQVRDIETQMDFKALDVKLVEAALELAQVAIELTEVSEGPDLAEEADGPESAEYVGEDDAADMEQDADGLFLAEEMDATDASEFANENLEDPMMFEAPSPTKK
jgi:hypothetical protein